MEKHLLRTGCPMTDSHEDQSQEQTPTAPTHGRCSEEVVEAEPSELTISINNVVCSFEVGCRLDLLHITSNGAHTDYRDKKRLLIMKLLRPCVTAHIWSTGSINVTGATSEEDAKLAAHRYTRVLANMGYPTTLTNFRIVNVMGTSSLPWAVRIAHFSVKYDHICSYAPEIHPGANFTLNELNATACIFANGSVTITANSVLNVQEAMKKVMACCYEFRRSTAKDVAGNNDKMSSHLNDGLGVETSSHDSFSGTAKADEDDCGEAAPDKDEPISKDEGEIQGSILHPKRFKRT